MLYFNTNVGATLNVRDGALRRQNRVLIWIDGHIPSRVIEFFLTVLSNPSRCWS